MRKTKHMYARMMFKLTSTTVSEVFKNKESEQFPYLKLLSELNFKFEKCQNPVPEFIT